MANDGVYFNPPDRTPEMIEQGQVWAWMHGPGEPHWEIRGTGLVTACPTPCDADCVIGCHEWHLPRGKRNHQPAACPTTGMWTQKEIDEINERAKVMAEEMRGLFE